MVRNNSPTDLRSRWLPKPDTESPLAKPKPDPLLNSDPETLPKSDPESPAKSDSTQKLRPAA